MSGARSAVRMTSRLTQCRAGRVPVLFPAVTRSAAPCRDAAGWELGNLQIEALRAERRRRGCCLRIVQDRSLLGPIQSRCCPLQRTAAFYCLAPK